MGGLLKGNKLVEQEASKPLSNSVLGQAAVATVPTVTAGFWVTKVLTTGMGETGADFLFYDQLGMIALALAGIGLVAALVCSSSEHAGTCPGSTGWPSPW